MESEHTPTVAVNFSCDALERCGCQKTLQQLSRFIGQSEQPADQLEETGLFPDIEQLEQLRRRVPTEGGEKSLGLILLSDSA